LLGVRDGSEAEYVDRGDIRENFAELVRVGERTDVVEGAVEVAVPCELLGKAKVFGAGVERIDGGAPEVVDDQIGVGTGALFEDAPVIADTPLCVGVAAERSEERGVEVFAGRVADHGAEFGGDGKVRGAACLTLEGDGVGVGIVGARGELGGFAVTQSEIAAQEQEAFEPRRCQQVDAAELLV